MKATVLHMQPEILPAELYTGLVLTNDAARKTAEGHPRGLIRDPFLRRICDTALRVGADGGDVSAGIVKAVLGADPGFDATRPDYLDLLAAAAPVVTGIDRLAETLRHETGLPGRTAYALKTVANLSEAPASDYIWKGLIVPGESSVFYGEPGSAKTFLVLYCAYLIALGSTCFNRRVRRAGVVFAALEGEIGLVRRLHALKDRLGPASDFHWVAQAADLYDGQGDVEGLIDAVLKAGAKLLVIDTLARAMGAGSENEARDMGQVIAAVDHIRRETGAHVALIHHCGKDSARGMRGHSSLLAAVDMAFEVKRQDPGPRTVKVAKSKDGADGEEFAFDLEVVDLGQDDDGDLITTCIVMPSSEPPGPAKSKVTGQPRVALDLLTRAVTEAGQPAPAGANFPRDKHVVPLTLWRQYCYQGFGEGRDNAATLRQAFGRARTTLQNKGLVGIWGEFVWPL